MNKNDYKTPWKQYGNKIAIRAGNRSGKSFVGMGEAAMRTMQNHMAEAMLEAFTPKKSKLDGIVDDIIRGL
jgi:hypothetical protein